MNKKRIEKYFRSGVFHPRKPINEGLLGMIVAYKTLKWLTTDSMEAMEDVYGDLQEVAEDLQSAAQEAIEDVEDRVIRETIVDAAEESVSDLQDAVNAQRESLKNKITQEVEGSDELKDSMDEKDIDAMVSLALTATLANVIVALSSE